MTPTERTERYALAAVIVLAALVAIGVIYTLRGGL